MKKDLIVKDIDGLFFTSTRKIADSLKDGVSKKRDDGIHRNLNKILVEKVLREYESIVPYSLGQASSKYICNITGATFEESVFKYEDRKRTAKTWLMNEEGYHLFITHITKYKNARKVNLDFILAFKLMRNIIKNQPQDTSKFKQIDTSKFGELSKTGNGLGRTEEVVGSFRSNKNSELSKLFGTRTRLRNKLSGLFDIEILESIEKIDIEITSIKKTEIQEQLSEEVLNKKLLS